MKANLDTRLARLEAKTVRDETYLVVGACSDSDQEAAQCWKRGDREEARRRAKVPPNIADEHVLWIEIVPVSPPDRPPWNEGRPVVSWSEL